MTATAEMVVARREIIAILVATNGKGLPPDELVAKVCKRVKDLTEKQARAVINSMAAGGAGRGLPQIRKKAGRWQTDYKVVPAEVKLIVVDETPSRGDAAKQRADAKLERVVRILEDHNAWVTKRELLELAGPLDPKLLRRLVDEKLVVRHGATKSTRYSAAGLHLPPPETASPGTPQASRVVKGAEVHDPRKAKPLFVPLTLSPKLQRAIKRVEEAIAHLRQVVDQPKVA